MASPTTPTPGSRARGQVLVPLVAVVVAVLALAGLGGVALNAGPERLRPSLVGIAAASPVVDLAPSTTAPAVDPETARSARSGPIDVPADSYAPEPIQQVGTIQIPKIGLDQRLMNGVTLRNIDLGPSHWPGTPWPGQPGNMVVAGHRVTHTHPFLHIDQLQPGDQMVVTANGTRAVYQVVTSFIVRPTEVARVLQASDQPTLTIFGCHPPHSARFRYVVRGVLVSAAPA